MTTPSSRPEATPAPVNLRGAVDLSSLKNRSAPAPAAAGTTAAGTAGGAPAENDQTPAPGEPSAHRFILNITEETFPQLIELSAQVPVVVDLWSARSEASGQLSPILQSLAVEYNGRILLARVDVDTSAQIAQAFQTQSVPAVVAVVKGQPVPLFEGSQPEAQVRAVFEELLRVAQENGVTGSLEGDPAEPGAEAEPPPLPPLHQEAFDAIETGDYAHAAAAYKKALAEQPADADAKAGLAQVELMLRMQDVDGPKLREEAAQTPDSVPTQLAVADLDILGGHVEDAFARLVGVVGRTVGEDREAARARLVEFFDVVGPADPRVTKARSALARALF